MQILNLLQQILHLGYHSLTFLKNRFHSIQFPHISINSLEFKNLLSR